MKIFHIINEQEWKAKNSDAYVPKDFEREGFIHCSKQEQFIQVANAKFKNQTDLLLLEINSEKVNSPIKFEKLTGMSEEHPHIYGPLNTNAITKAYRLIPDVNGFFTQPREENVLK